MLGPQASVSDRDRASPGGSLADCTILADTRTAAPAQARVARDRRVRERRGYTGMAACIRLAHLRDSEAAVPFSSRGAARKLCACVWRPPGRGPAERRKGHRSVRGGLSELPQRAVACADRSARSRRLAAHVLLPGQAAVATWAAACVTPTVHRVEQDPGLSQAGRSSSPSIG